MLSEERQRIMIKSRKSISFCPKYLFRGNLKFSGYAIFILSLLALCHGCGNRQSGAQETEVIQENIVPFTKSDVKYAKGFSLEYFDHYKILNILHHSAKKTDTLKYVLLQRGKPAPKGFNKEQIIPIPVKKIIGMSSIQVALADFAESTDVLAGLANLQYVNSSKVKENIKAKKILEVGEEGSLNNEIIISMRPDMLMGTGTPSADFSRYQTLQSAEIPVILNIEWLENTPLGRAEWVKVFAALVNKESLVNEKFDIIEKEYKRLAAIGQQAKNKPTLIVGLPFKGSWFVPDGSSFMTQFFKDAGGFYSWANTKGTGSMGLSFESVAPVALNADFWINTGTATSKDYIASMDQRYTFFKPFKNNTIYNFNKKVNELGSNDYWESGAVNPQLVLADLIKILHPGLLPAHELVYYKQIL